MTMIRGWRRSAALGAALVLASAGAALAQNYPDRPVRVTVPYAAGGASDIVTRIVVEKVGATLGQQFVVENQAGAGGNIGTNAIARAEPDGYRLLVSASGPLATNKWIVATLPYDPEKDLEPISLLANLPNIVVVTKGLPPKSLAEVVAWVKSQEAGTVTYSSIGIGSSQHLAGVYFEQVTGTRMKHLPYTAAGPMATDLMTGTVPLSFQLLPNVHGQVKSGDIRPIAVASKVRASALPDVPTTAEAGMPDFVSAAWFAMLAPKGTPAPIIEKLNKAVVAALGDPAIKQKLIEAGAEPASSTPAELRALISGELAKWKTIVEKAGIKPRQ
jgi:tripartite-type tricarboxylate transporter receptor subunit TctC